MRQTHISILGSYDREYDGHIAIREAIIHAERALEVVINTRWLTPDELAEPATALAGSCGVLVACRNPKHLRRLMPDVLVALRHARETGLPVLGLEGGYQHMLIEFAKSIANQPEAGSTAYDEDCEYPVIKRLDPDAVDGELRAEEAEFELVDGSQLAAIHENEPRISEVFRSQFTLNADYLNELVESGLVIAARGQREDRNFAAAIEWKSARKNESANDQFWIGVAYLPQYASREDRPHPLFAAFVEAALARSH